MRVSLVVSHRVGPHPHQFVPQGLPLGIDALHEQVTEVAQIVGFASQLHSFLFPVHAFLELNLVLKLDDLLVAFGS